MGSLAGFGAFGLLRSSGFLSSGVGACMFAVGL